MVADLFDAADELTELIEGLTAERRLRLGERPLDQRRELRHLEVGADDLGCVQYMARSFGRLTRK